MQETFYIIKKLTPHNKKKNKCNNRVYEIQYDKNGQYGIVINFEKQNEEYNDDDDETLNESPEDRNNSYPTEEILKKIKHLSYKLIILCHFIYQDNFSFMLNRS